MSTVPGREAWRDAGLVEIDPAAAVELELEPELNPLEDVPVAAAPVEEHEPAEPRPDLRGEADVGDVAEQATPVPSDERDDYP